MKPTKMKFLYFLILLLIPLVSAIDLSDSCLVAYYPLNESCNDLTGNHNLSENNGVVCGTGRLFDTQNSTDFNGINQYLNTSNIMESDWENITISALDDYLQTESLDYINNRSIYYECSDSCYLINQT